MAGTLKNKGKNGPNKDGTMTDKEQQEFSEKVRGRIDLAQPSRALKRGASNAGYHYLGCAKTFALMGKHFAEALLKLPQAN